MNKIVLMLKNWKTSSVGIISAAISLLVGLNILDVDPAQAVETTNTAFTNIVAALAGLQALIAFFSKDSDKTSESLGLSIPGVGSKDPEK